ncbi:MAG: class I SAM-dependent methyltransferase [Candidatus Thorarchaeota archaeon]|nr:MAG: class I SAM-dependent methyltransferase [Candidatus Thorarchaeota archaeon]
MTPERTPELFDSWAENYDDFVDTVSDRFPFAGYHQVLDRMVELSDPKEGMRVLDMGIGTGGLAKRFVDFNCEIWGLDYSSKMLEKAAQKVPSAHLVKADIRSEWPSELRIGFDLIVSAYSIHHLDLNAKLDTIKRMHDELLNKEGRIVIGDVSFRSFAERAAARRELAHEWDDYEYYWAADETKTMLWGEGLYVVYEQISFCGGVYLIVSV